MITVVRPFSSGGLDDTTQSEINLKKNKRKKPIVTEDHTDDDEKYK